jgi:hypothetical protein
VKFIAAYLRESDQTPLRVDEKAALIWAHPDCSKSGALNTFDGQKDASDCGLSAQVVEEERPTHAEFRTVSNRIVTSYTTLFPPASAGSIGASTGFNVQPGKYTHMALEMCKGNPQNLPTVRWKSSSMGTAATHTVNSQCSIMTKISPPLEITSATSSTKLIISYDMAFAVFPASSPDAALPNALCATDECVLMPTFRLSLYTSSGNIVEAGTITTAPGGQPMSGATVELYRPPDNSHTFSPKFGLPRPHLLASETTKADGAFSFSRYSSDLDTSGSIILAPDTLAPLRPDASYVIHVRPATPADVIPGPAKAHYAGGFAVQPGDVDNATLATDVRDRGPDYAVAARTIVTPLPGALTLPIDISFEPNFVITNRLLGPDATPLPAVRVELYDVTEDPSGAAGVYLGFTMTDEAGVYVLPANVVGIVRTNRYAIRVDLWQATLIRTGNSAGPLIPAAYADDNKFLSVEGRTTAQVRFRVGALGSDGGSEGAIAQIGRMQFTEYDCGSVGECSGHGTCLSDFECVCDSPWSGPSCSEDSTAGYSTPAPPTPAGNGTQTLPNGLVPCGNGRVFDYCGVCGGNGESCKEKKKGATIAGIRTPFNPVFIYLILAMCLVTCAIIALAQYRRRSRRQAAEDDLSMEMQMAALQGLNAPTAPTPTAVTGVAYPNGNMSPTAYPTSANIGTFGGSQYQLAQAQTGYAPAGAVIPDAGVYNVPTRSMSVADGMYAPAVNPTYGNLTANNSMYGAPPSTSPGVAQYESVSNTRGSAALSPTIQRSSSVHQYQDMDPTAMYMPATPPQASPLSSPQGYGNIV